MWKSSAINSELGGIYVAKTCKIISIINQKGGVGKTTSVQHIGYCLAVEHHKKILLVDLDPQANLTSTFGISPEKLDYSIFDVLKGDVPLSRIIKSVSRDGHLDIAPANIDLSRAEIELISEINSTYLLKSAITPPFVEPTQGEEPYDFILTDCPPSLGILTVNALAASDYVIIPIQPEMYALQGLGALETTIEKVRTRANPSLAVLGWVITLHDGRTRVHKDVAEFFRKKFGPNLFNTVITVNTTIREAQAAKKTVFQYDSAKSGAKNYAALVDEILQRIGERNG